MKTLTLSTLIILLSCALSTSVDAQVVNIPDANFKAYLVGNAAINTNGDTEIQVSEASVFTGTIQSPGSSISDLTGIEAFTSLTILNVSNNPLGTIDISQNTALQELHLALCQLTSLDASANSALTSINCSVNPLTSLNMANGNNINIPGSGFSATSLGGLTCIQVDDVAYSTTNWTNVDASVSFSTNCNAPCIVNIPDANFKAYLVGNTTINTNGNSEIECSEASTFTGVIFCPNLSISNLTGIESFPLLTELTCYNNSITNLDISQNTALTNLLCDDNSINNLDVSQNTALTELTCSDNSISNLDISQNTNLNTLRCVSNSLSSLDVSQNTALIGLFCDDNSITHLDVSQNTALINLFCKNNSLGSLNIANGNNTNFTFIRAEGNPNLTCINVDDVAYSTTNWTFPAYRFDATASFSTNCTPVSINKLENKKLANVQIYPNPTTKDLTINLDKNYKEITILISNGIGQTVLSKEYTAKQFINLDLEGNSGVYFVTIFTEDGLLTTKIVKE